MTLTRHCRCGAVLRIDVPRAKKAQALAVWYAQHDGPGHGDATATEAEEARGVVDGREARKERER